MSRIAIFGGSFDPPHNGHLGIINHLTAVFDRVFVVPCELSPFKARSTPIQTRLEMLNGMLKDVAGVEVSDCEAGRSPNYSVDTLELFAQRLPGDQLHFVVGSDCLDTISNWRRYDRILQLAKIYVIGRPHFEVRKQGDRFEYADFVGLDISSAEVRASASFGRLAQFVPSAVATIVSQQGLYAEHKHIVDSYPDFCMKPSRTEHICRSVLCGIRLAKLWNCDVDKTVLAMVLHDIGKYVTLERAQQMGLPTEDLHQLPENCRHALIGRRIAQRDFGVCDSDVLDAIEFHTTGKPAMTLLQKIVYLADAVEEGRTGVEEIRQQAYVDLDKAMALALADSLASIRQRQLPNISPLTLSAHEYYTKIIGDKK